VFERFAERYDSWYDRHRDWYLKELELLRDFVGSFRRGLEVGVGTGRFARDLGIRYGVDIADSMLRLSRSRGVEVVKADASRLPFRDEVFDLVLFALTLCFLSDPIGAFAEAYRVLERSGRMIVCGVPADSELGREYSMRKDSPFYRFARLYRVDEVIEMAEHVGFKMGRSGYADLKYGKDVFCLEFIR